MKKKKKISNEEKLRREVQSQKMKFGYSKREMMDMIDIKLKKI